MDGTDLRSGYAEAFKIEHRGLPGCGWGWGGCLCAFPGSGRYTHTTHQTHIHILTSSGTWTNIKFSVGLICNGQKLVNSFRTSSRKPRTGVFKGATESGQGRLLTNTVHSLSNTSAFQKDRPAADKHSQSVHFPIWFHGTKQLTDDPMIPWVFSQPSLPHPSLSHAYFLHFTS